MANKGILNSFAANQRVAKADTAFAAVKAKTEEFLLKLHTEAKQDTVPVRAYVSEFVDLAWSWGGDAESFADWSVEFRRVIPLLKEITDRVERDPKLSKKEKGRVGSFATRLQAFVIKQTTIATKAVGRFKQVAKARRDDAPEAPATVFQHAGKAFAAPRAKSRVTQDTAVPAKIKGLAVGASAQPGVQRLRGEEVANAPVTTVSPDDNNIESPKKRRVQRVPGNTRPPSHAAHASATLSALLDTDRSILKATEGTNKILSSNTELMQEDRDAAERHGSDIRRPVKSSTDYARSHEKESKSTGSLFSGIMGMFAGGLSGLLKTVTGSLSGFIGGFGAALGKTKGALLKGAVAYEATDIAGKELDSKPLSNMKTGLGLAATIGSYNPLAGLAVAAGTSAYEGLWNQRGDIMSLMSTPLQTMHAVQDMAGSAVAGHDDYYATKANDEARSMTVTPPKVDPQFAPKPKTALDANKLPEEGAMVPDRPVGLNVGKEWKDDKKKKTFDYQRYSDIIGKRESSGNYAAENQFGYLGKYQMGVAALKDAGLMKPNVKQSRTAVDNQSNWILPGGKAAFLKNVDLQEKVMKEYTDRNLSALKRLKVVTDKSEGSDIAGNLAASHLVGPGTVAKKGMGSRDGNGTSAQQYYDLVQGPSPSRDAASVMALTASTAGGGSVIAPVTVGGGGNAPQVSQTTIIVPPPMFTENPDASVRAIKSGNVL